MGSIWHGRCDDLSARQQGPYQTSGQQGIWESQSLTCVGQRAKTQWHSVCDASTANAVKHMFVTMTDRPKVWRGRRASCGMAPLIAAMHANRRADEPLLDVQRRRRRRITLLPHMGQ
jgi:hypothetical protein